MDLIRTAAELYQRGRIYDALEVAQAACERSPKDAKAWRLLARVARHCNLPAASADAQQRAARLDPTLRPPLRLTAAEFRRLLAEIAPEAEVQVRPLPSPGQIRAGLMPDAEVARDAGSGRVTLFQDNLEEGSSSLAELREHVARNLTEVWRR